MSDNVIVSTNIVIDELKLILHFIDEQIRASNRVGLSDVHSRMTSVLSFDFVDYFKFLKLYKFVSIDRADQCLSLTEKGLKLLGSGTISNEDALALKKQFGDRIEESQELIEFVEESSLDPPSVEQPPRTRRERSGSSDGMGVQASARAPDNVRKDSSASLKASERYSRQEKIGSGGFGTVFRGMQNSLLLPVAIKEMRELLSCFPQKQRSQVIGRLREVISQMALLEHPHIVRVFDANLDTDIPYFVMEYLSGGNLRRLMPGLAAERRLILFTQICHALRAAHRRGVVHGNLKPENIVLDGFGNVRVTDFGMLRLFKLQSDRLSARLFTGAISYFSPEQMTDPAAATRNSDIHSLGIMFYELLTGQLPSRRSPLPSEVDPATPKIFDELFDRMTRDRPADRVPDMDAVLEILMSAHGVHIPGRLILYAEPLAASSMPAAPEEGTAPAAKPVPDKRPK